MKNKTHGILIGLLLMLPIISMSQTLEIVTEGNVVIVNSTETVHFTTDGRKPGINSDVYTGPVEMLYPQQNEILNRLEDFVVPDLSWMFASEIYEGWDYFLYEPDPLFVKKKNIFRACIHCGTQDEVSLIQTVGEGVPEGWQFEYIFDQPSQFLDGDTGAYVAGPGIHLENADLNFSGIAPNYSIGEERVVVELIEPDIRDSIPDYLIDGVKCTAIFSKDGLVVHETTGRIRVNGGASISKPLKGLKFEADEASDDIPFLETGHVYFRRPSTHGMSDLLWHQMMRRLEPHIPKIAKPGTQGHVMLHGGSHLESMGRYHIYPSGDKTYAREHLGFGSDVQKFEVKAPHPVAGHVITEGFDTVEVMLTARAIQDTATLFTQPYSVLESYINVKAWLAFYFQLGLFRGTDVLNNNMQFFAENGLNFTPILTDGDGLFDPYYFDIDGNAYDNLAYNHLESAVRGYPSLWNGASRDNVPYWILRALMYYPGMANRNQNFQLDLLAIGFQQDEIDFLADSSRTAWLGGMHEYSHIEHINGVDTIWMPTLLNRNINFVAAMNQAFMRNFIDLYHPGYDTTDIFNIHVDLNDVFGNDCNNGGFAMINTMKFTESGSRIHIRDFPVQVEAVPLPGFEFSHWEEYPDSAASFILVHDVSEDMTLTPVFQEEQDVCVGQGELVVNELLPWSAAGTEDKIEIYNPTSNPVSLIGMCLSDKPDNPCRWVFPEDPKWVVEADSFIVISESDINFSLSKNGESCTLSYFDSTLVSEIVYEALPSSSVTVGLCDNTVQFMEPTIGFTNSCVIDGVDEYALAEKQGPVKYFDLSGRLILGLDKDVEPESLRSQLVSGIYLKRYVNYPQAATEKVYVP